MKKLCSLKKTIQNRFVLFTLMLTLVTLGIVTAFHLAGQRRFSSGLENLVLSQARAILNHHNEYLLEIQEEENTLLADVIQEISWKWQRTPRKDPEKLLRETLSIYPERNLHKFHGKEMHYYHISSEGLITETTNPKDKNLDLSRYPEFWKRLRTLKAGTTLLQSPIPSTKEAVPTRYIYQKQPDGSILELSLSANDFYLSGPVELIKKLPLVARLAIYHHPTLLPGDPSFPPLMPQDKPYLAPLLERKEDVTILRKGLLAREIFFSWKKFPEGKTRKGYLPGRWIVHISLSTEWLQHLCYISLALLSFTLLGAGFLFSFQGEKIALAVSTPIKKILEGMEMLSAASETGTSLPSKKIFPENTKNLWKIKEIHQLAQGFESMASRITESFDAQHNALKRERETSRQLNKILDSTLAMTQAVSSQNGTLLSTVLQHALSLVPEAEHGAVTMITGGICTFKSVHFPEGTANIPLEHLSFPCPRNCALTAKTFRAESYLSTLSSPLEKTTEEQITRLFPPSGEVLIKPFSFGAKYAGELILGKTSSGSPEHFSPRSLKALEALGNATAAFLGLEQFILSQDLFQKELLMSMAGILETHDPYTQGHSESVAVLGGRLARELGLPEKEIQQTYWAGLVHDIGKLLVPKDILNKPSGLTGEEYRIIQQHPVLGYTVLSKTERLKEISRVVLHHHERWDGKGYPDQLREKTIPKISRILTIVDAWDAMTSTRSYRQALSPEEAFQEILEGAGTQFDPYMTEKFLSLMNFPETQRDGENPEPPL